MIVYKLMVLYVFYRLTDLEYIFYICKSRLVAETLNQCKGMRDLSDVDCVSCRWNEFRLICSKDINAQFCLICVCQDRGRLAVVFWYHTAHATTQTLAVTGWTRCFLFRWLLGIQAGCSCREGKGFLSRASREEGWESQHVACSRTSERASGSRTFLEPSEKKCFGEALRQ